MGITNCSWKVQGGDSVNYLGYKIDLQKTRIQKAQIKRDQLQTLNDFQRLLGDISSLQLAVQITPDLTIHLNKTLDGDKDMNSPSDLTAETKKELKVVEEKLQEANVDRVYANLNYILVILSSKISPAGILMHLVWDRKKKYFRKKFVFLHTYFVYIISFIEYMSIQIMFKFSTINSRFSCSNLWSFWEENGAPQ